MSIGTAVFGNERAFRAAVLCLIGTLVIGDADYLTGYRISLLVLYIIPIGYATIYVSHAYSNTLAALSVAVSVCSSFCAGVPSDEVPLLFVNAFVAFSGFLISTGLLNRWKMSAAQHETVP